MAAATPAAPRSSSSAETAKPRRRPASSSPASAGWRATNWSRSPDSRNASSARPWAPTDGDGGNRRGSRRARTAQGARRGRRPRRRCDPHRQAHGLADLLHQPPHRRQGRLADLQTTSGSGAELDERHAEREAARVDVAHDEALRGKGVEQPVQHRPIQSCRGGDLGDGRPVGRGAQVAEHGQATGQGARPTDRCGQRLGHAHAPPVRASPDRGAHRHPTRLEGAARARAAADRCGRASAGVKPAASLVPAPTRDRSPP